MILSEASPSLHGAKARVDRAGGHLAALKVELHDRCSRSKRIVAHSGGGISIPPEKFSLPPLASILIGECVHNLRCALDYLVYEMAILDTGRALYGTKFPIEDSRRGWAEFFEKPGMKPKDIKALWMPQLTAAHQREIEKMQPFSGCTWTHTLRSLSNPEKHRRLLKAVAEHSGRVQMASSSGPSFMMI